MTTFLGCGFKFCSLSLEMVLDSCILQEVFSNGLAQIPAFHMFCRGSVDGRSPMNINWEI